MNIQIATNPVTAKLINADREIKLQVSELLSYLVEGYEHTDAYQVGRWDGRSTFFDYRSGTFPAGFVVLVVKALKSLGHTVRLVRQPRPAPLGPEDPKVDDFPDDPRYDYQNNTVDRLVRYGQMVAQIATGGGKSRIAKKATARIRRPTLFLTTRSVLMHQMREHYEDAGFNCGVLGDGEWRLTRGVNVGMVQSIMPKIAEPDVERMSRAEIEKQMARRAKMAKILEYFEFMILEEAHEAGGNGYYDILRHCRNAHYRLALTATPFMRDDSEANMRLMACAGSVGIQVSEKMLIDRGILATPYFRYANTLKPAGLCKTMNWPAAYKNGITENEFRNKEIVAEVMEAASFGLTSMVLVQHKAHGKLLEEMLRQAGIRAKFIFGEHSQAARDQALNALKNGELDCLIGSTILDVGVDVPAVGLVVLAGGGKAEVQLRQRIGRGLREKKLGPNVAFILDFEDNGHRTLRKHARERHAIIDSTPGFAENVLKGVRRFDYGSYGLSRAA